MQTGIVVHVYNLATPGWEEMMWGDPASNKLGCLTKLCQLMMSKDRATPIDKVIIFSGPSTHDGLSEGGYTKQFLLGRLSQLDEFSCFRPFLDGYRDWQYELRQQIEAIILGEQLVRTSDEVRRAVQAFAYPEFGHVIQLACAGHAPRCMQQQTIARANGLITAGQLWSVVAADTTFGDTTPEDTVIFEKPHLEYDPMFGVKPEASEVLRHYFSLPPEAKRAFLEQAHTFMKQNSNKY